jgi:hypothetical protein
MVLRAGLVGLCIGLVMIGLLENLSRFGSPETLRSQDRILSSQSPSAVEQPGRADREDRLSMAVIER